MDRPFSHIHATFQTQRRILIPPSDVSRKMHEMRELLSNPDNLDEFMSLQLIGSPETVRSLQAYIDLGFDKFVVTTNTPDIARVRRHQWLARFAREVMPDFVATPNGAVATVRSRSGVSG